LLVVRGLTLSEAEIEALGIAAVPVVFYVNVVLSRYETGNV
jgi:hypothetical protein